MKQEITQEIKEQFMKDANESIYSPNQLTSYDPRSFEVLYPELVFANRMLPFQSLATPGSTKYSYYAYDKTGLAELRATYSKDSPKVNVTGAESLVDIYPIQASMEYNDQELKADAMANKNLIQKKRQALIDSFQRRLDIVIASGQSDVGLTGITNHPNVSEYTIPNGVGGDSEWSTKTANEILADILGMISGMIAASKGVHKINMFMVPVAQYALIAGTRIGTDTTTTILGFIRDTYPAIEFVESTRLAGAGAGDSDMIIGCELSPDNFAVELSQDYQEFPINQTGALYEQEAHMRTAGLIVYRPLTIIRGEGI